MAQQNGHATLKKEESSEDVLDSLTQKMASALGSLGLIVVSESGQRRFFKHVGKSWLVGRLV